MYLIHLDMKERKGSTNEGGVRVPFFIQWPKKIKKGLVFSLTNQRTNIGFRHNLLNNKQN